MTAEEYLADFAEQWQLTPDQMQELQELGLRAVPCWCKGARPGCLGWQIVLGDDDLRV